MIKMICDLCGKEIRKNSDYIQVTIETSSLHVGDTINQRFHLHKDCGAFLRKKVNAECKRSDTE